MTDLLIVGSRWYLASAPIVTAAIVVFSFLSPSAPLLAASRPSLFAILRVDICDILDLLLDSFGVEPAPLKTSPAEKIYKQCFFSIDINNVLLHPHHPYQFLKSMWRFWAINLIINKMGCLF